MPNTGPILGLLVRCLKSSNMLSTLLRMTAAKGGREWARSEDGSLRWISMQTEHLEPALQVMRASFFPNESISKALRLSETPKAAAQFERIATITAQDGVSVVCAEASSGNVIGVAFNKLHVKQPPGEKDYLDVIRKEDHDPAFVEALRYMDKVDGCINYFDHYGVDCYMEHMFLATLPDWGRRGVGRGLVKSTVEVAKALAQGEQDVVTTMGKIKPPQPPLPGAVIAVFTSSISQRIGSSLGWEVLASIKHSDLYYQGEPYSARIGPEHPSSTIMGIRVNP